MKKQRISKMHRASGRELPHMIPGNRLLDKHAKIMRRLYLKKEKGNEKPKQNR